MRKDEQSKERNPKAKSISSGANCKKKKMPGK
jgi:hypothetical protein